MNSNKLQDVSILSAKSEQAKTIIKQFTSTKLMTSSGLLNIQGLTKKWFTKHKYGEYFHLFEDNDLLDIKSLYNFINNETGICKCGTPKRFLGFSVGYKLLCPKCNKKSITSIINANKAEVDNIEIPPDISFLKRDLIKLVLPILKDVKGGYSASKIKFPKINQYKENLYQDIISTTFYIPKDHKFCERLYHIENNLFEIPRCKSCNVPLDNFISNKEGYFDDYCKINKCGLCKPLSEKQKDGILKYQFKKHEIFVESLNTEEYTNSGINFEEYQVHGLNTKINFTHLKCNRTYDFNIGYQGNLRCPYCYPVRSKQQFYIYDFIKNELNIDCLFNDRKILNGSELDIVYKNIAIEYDGQKFHSYGKSSDTKFNTYLNEDKNQHINKTKKCEELNIQLFRIFSSEWLTKESIWKSVIKTALGLNKRIYARKCDLRVVTSAEAKIFLDSNHLQGNVNASIKLGLFYNEELISIMTFGVPRQLKYKGINNYELLRFCSKQGITVVGGASKLLKYFERNYNPKMIISYANRRWSIGNLYYKIGFEFIEYTPPNHFYIKGNDFETGKLQSRIQFQKHKLKDKLEIYDDKLSGTENMYNNNYRKIYDCGNMLFVKKF